MKKGKDIFRLVGLVLVILFLALYFGQYTGYYTAPEERKTTLTNDAIKRFEEDVMNGKKIDASNYLTKENNYNNSISKMGLGLSGLVEKGFNKIINAIFNEIEKAIKK